MMTCLRTLIPVILLFAMANPRLLRGDGPADNHPETVGEFQSLVLNWTRTPGGNCLTESPGSKGRSTAWGRTHP